MEPRIVRGPTHLRVLLASLACASTASAQGIVVTDGPAPLPVAEEFDDITTGELAGILVGNGVSFAEDCVGQTTVELPGQWELTSGAPSVPLTLATPPAMDGLFGHELFYTSRISGLAQGLYQGDIGEGAVAILYDAPQDVVGLEISGGLNGSVTFQCYDSQGGLIGVASVPNQPYRELTITSLGEEIRLINFSNDAVYGVAFGRLRHTFVAEGAFCFGDGNGATCPCGNFGALGHGCANGTTAEGALLVTVFIDGLTLTGATPLQPVLFFQGVNATGGGDGVAFGDGLRCVGGDVLRLLVTAADASGSVTLQSISGWGGGGGPGLRYQAWYRDPQLSPCGSGFNLSNGVEIP